MSIIHETVTPKCTRLVMSLFRRLFASTTTYGKEGRVKFAIQLVMSLFRRLSSRCQVPELLRQRGEMCRPYVPVYVGTYNEVVVL